MFISKLFRRGLSDLTEGEIQSTPDPESFRASYTRLSRGIYFVTDNYVFDKDTELFCARGVMFGVRNVDLDDLLETIKKEKRFSIRKRHFIRISRSPVGATRENAVLTYHGRPVLLKRW